MKGPVGKCRYCGQEFMSRQGLKMHERTTCPQRPPDPPEKEPNAAPAQKPAHFKPRHIAGGTTVWTRSDDERF